MESQRSGPGGLSRSIGTSVDIVEILQRKRRIVEPNVDGKPMYYRR
jgi:hypothetical protein